MFKFAQWFFFFILTNYCAFSMEEFDFTITSNLSLGTGVTYSPFLPKEASITIRAEAIFKLENSHGKRGVSFTFTDAKLGTFEIVCFDNGQESFVVMAIDKRINLGSGGRADVFLAQKLEKKGSEDFVVAAKISTTPDFTADLDFERDWNINMRIKGRYFGHFYHVYSDPISKRASTARYLFIEYNSGINLANCLKKLPLALKYKAAKAIMSALYELHKKGIIHGDLKMNNILIKVHDENIEAYIIDFGSSSLATWEKGMPPALKPYVGFAGTCGNQPWERYGRNGPPLSKQTDLWSLGSLWAELFSERDLAVYLIGNKRKYPTDGYFIQKHLLKAFPDIFISAIDYCSLSKSDPNRASFLQIIYHLCQSNVVDRPSDDEFANMVEGDSVKRSKSDLRHKMLRLASIQPTSPRSVQSSPKISPKSESPEIPKNK